MLTMTSSSKVFLEKHLPAALETNDMRTALRALYDLIDEKGFAPPHYENYNDFGREAQVVYDDIYLSNSGGKKHG